MCGNNINWLFFCSSLPPVVCRRAHVLFTLHIVVSNTYCAVLLFCFSLSCVPYDGGFSGWISPFLIAPSVFSNVFFSLDYIMVKKIVVDRK